MGKLFIFLVNFVKDIENPEDYEVYLQKYLVFRTVIYIILSIFIMLLWGLFDYFVDFQHFILFLKLRIAYAATVLIIFMVYLFKNLPYEKYKLIGFLNYILLIAAVFPMVMVTEQKLAYFLGFSVIFFGTSVIMIWPVIYMFLPMVITFLFYIIFCGDNILNIETMIIAIFMPTVFIISAIANIISYNDYIVTKYLMEKLSNKNHTNNG